MAESAAPSGKEPKNVVRSAVKVLDALRLLVQSYEPLSATNLARELGVSETTAFRAAETLVACGFAKHIPRGGGYIVTFDLLELAGGIVENGGIRDLARGSLVEVARTYGETITLAVRDGNNVIFIDRVEGSRDLRTFCEVGRRLPLHAGAAARCVLANLDEAEFEEYTSIALAQVTPRTLVTREELKADREAILTQGFAASFDEVDPGVWAVGVPIHDAGGDLTAAAAIATKTGQWTKNDILMRARAMREAAHRIQQRYWQLNVRRRTK